MTTTVRLPDHVLHPKHPERICWGCDRYCPAKNLACGNGKVRTQHPVELFGEDWLESELAVDSEAGTAPDPDRDPPT